MGLHNENRNSFGMKSIILRKMNSVASMAEHGMLSSASKLVYLTVNTGKWPAAPYWAHASES